MVILLSLAHTHTHVTMTYGRRKTINEGFPSYKKMVVDGSNGESNLLRS